MIVYLPSAVCVHDMLRCLFLVPLWALIRPQCLSLLYVSWPQLPDLLIQICWSTAYPIQFLSLCNSNLRHDLIVIEKLGNNPKPDHQLKNGHIVLRVILESCLLLKTMVCGTHRNTVIFLSIWLGNRSPKNWSACNTITELYILGN